MPRNTRKDFHNDPLLALLGAMGGTERYIDNMEAQGQRELVAEMVLPIKGIDDYREGGPYASLGIKVGERASADADELFVKVELPPGWTKVATSHSMWSDIVDERGRPRIGVFYKAAFYDRDAHIGPPRRRYTVAIGNDNKTYADDPEMSTHRIVVDNAFPMQYNDHGYIEREGAILHSVVLKRQHDAQKGFELSDAADAAARAWLDEHFPQHNDPLAYWDNK